MDFKSPASAIPPPGPVPPSVYHGKGHRNMASPCGAAASTANREIPQHSNRRGERVRGGCRSRVPVLGDGKVDAQADLHHNHAATNLARACPHAYTVTRISGSPDLAAWAAAFRSSAQSHAAMASRMLLRASCSSLPWDTHPGSTGHSTTIHSSSALASLTWKTMPAYYQVAPSPATTPATQAAPASAWPPPWRGQAQAASRAAPEGGEGVCLLRAQGRS